jgi:agmatine/peptidylarginine deiminase
VWVIVSGAAQQSSATTTLTNAGADMSQVSFLIAPTDSVWIRDYGPRFVTEDGGLAIVDHTYNRPRPLDDVIPDFVAGAWSLPQYDIPLVHGGGNFHLFGDGEAFMSELILVENPGLTAQDVQDYFAQYEGLEVTIWPGFPSSYDSTRHIDMWLLPARNRRVIVGEYAAGEGSGVPRTITEDAVTELLARGYTVFRTPGWRENGTHFTYTNAVLFNKLVLVPQFNNDPDYADENAAALAVFQQAFPGYQVIPIDSTQLVTFAGVIHCIVMHVPDESWIFGDDFETGDLASWSAVVN